MAARGPALLVTRETLFTLPEEELAGASQVLMAAGDWESVVEGITWRPRCPGDVPPLLSTWGHGTKPVAVATAQLLHYGIAHVADVRSSPTSSRNPQHMGYAQDEWMGEAGITRTCHAALLGGHRKCKPDVRDRAWRVDGFLRYCPWMRDPRFLRGVAELVAIALASPTAIMCGETMWTQCHRKMVSDFFALVLHWRVRHLRDESQWYAHKPIPEAVAEGGKLYYDGAQLRFAGL